MSRRVISFGIIINFISLILFLGLSIGVLNGNFVDLDEAILGIIYSLRSPLLTQIMYLMSYLGGGFILLLSSFIALILLFKKHQKEAIFFIATVLSGFVLNNFLKYLLKVPRPDIDSLFNIGSYAFPSGHAMSSFIFYGLLVYLAYRFARNRGLSLLIAAFSIILILLIGFSRLYLGVHYPSDVIGGFIAGFWWLTTVILIEKTLVFYMRLKDRRR